MAEKTSSVKVEITCQKAGDPRITLYHVEVTTDDAVHGEETYGSEEQLRAFLKGVRVGCSARGYYLAEPEIPRSDWL